MEGKIADGKRAVGKIVKSKAADSRINEILKSFYYDRQLFE